MRSVRFAFEKTGQFSGLFTDYIAESEAVREFYGLYPSHENFLQQIRVKQAFFTREKRELLRYSLQKQYADLAPPFNLDILLSDKTFTITTGHQLCLLTGPLYFHYKIMTVIALANDLKKQFPAYNFVPVFWQASEDHDFEEISEVRIFGKKFRWQSVQKGAVGRFRTDEAEEVLSQIPDLPQEIAEFYRSSDNLAEATRKFVHHFYGNKGLLVVDGDDASLKKSFLPVIQKDIFDNIFGQETEKINALLEQKSYHTQIHPRKINHFFLENNARNRIEKKDDGFTVLNTEIFFSEMQMRETMEKNPEKFSPNVLLRPIYQESILPNLSYTGGPAETIYWLQLKAAFEAAEVPFPILVPRQFVMFLPESFAQKWFKAGFEEADIFKSSDELKKKYLQSAENEQTDFAPEYAETEILWEKIAEKAAFADKSLREWVLAEKSKSMKSLENIEKKVRKSLESKHETAVKQIFNLK